MIGWPVNKGDSLTATFKTTILYILELSTLNRRVVAVDLAPSEKPSTYTLESASSR